MLPWQGLAEPRIEVDIHVFRGKAIPAHRFFDRSNQCNVLEPQLTVGKGPSFRTRRPRLRVEERRREEGPTFVLAY
jgi:hypothetical protein